MDDWESVAVALQGVFVAFGGVAVLADGVGVRGVGNPFVLGAGLFAVGFVFGAIGARSRGDGASVALHAVAVLGWCGVLAGDALGPETVTWVGVALLGVAGVGLCYRAIRAWRADSSTARTG
jgi:hypothetical protein